MPGGLTTGSSRPSWFNSFYIYHDRARWGKLSKSYARGLVSLHGLQSQSFEFDGELKSLYGGTMVTSTLTPPDTFVRQLRKVARELLLLADRHPEYREQLRSEAVGVARAIHLLRESS